MTNDDLLRMLDLDGREPAPKGEPPAITPGVGTKPEAPASLTALHLDGWGERRGRDVLRESERLRGCLAGLGDEERQAHAVADFHAAAFETDPRLQDACADPLRLEFVRQLLETPECHELRASTVLNDTASEIAATAFAAQYAALREERGCGGKEKPGERHGGGTAGDFADEVAVLRRVGKALAEASKEVEEAREAAAALGMGSGVPGSNDTKAIAALFKEGPLRPRLEARLRACRTLSKGGPVEAEAEGHARHGRRGGRHAGRRTLAVAARRAGEVGAPRVGTGHAPPARRTPVHAARTPGRRTRRQGSDHRERR